MRSILLALLTALSCGDDGPALDAGAHLDAGRDARVLARDAGPRDAGQPDTGLADAGTRDGGPSDPGWVPMPGLPEGCVIERAERPETVFSQAWVPCEGYDGGCLVLDASPPVQRVLDPRVGWHDGERGYYEVVQGDVEPRSDARLTIVASTEQTLAAWRGPPLFGEVGCAVGIMAFGDGFGVFEIMTRIEGHAEARIYHAPLGDIGRVTEPVVILEGVTLPGSIQRFAVSSTTVAAEIQPGGVIAIIEGGGVVLRGGPTDPVARGIPQLPVVVGRDVFWQDAVYVTPRYRYEVLHATFTEPTARYLQASAGDLVNPAFDGGVVAWLQGYDAPPGEDYGRLELWTSPYSADPAELVPSLVGEVETRPIEANVGGGIFDGGGGVTGLEPRFLYDLADARRRQVPAPDGWVFVGETLYVTDREVAYPMRVPFRTIGGMMRVDPAVLAYDSM